MRASTRSANLLRRRRRSRTSPRRSFSCRRRSLNLLTSVRRRSRLPPPRRTPLTRAKRNSSASTACIPSDRTRGWTAAISTRSCGLAANPRKTNGASAECTAARRGTAEEGPRSTGAESRQGTSGPDSRGRHRPGKPPETAVSPLRVVLPQPAHVTKPAHETKLEIVTKPFVPTPEEASPTKTVTQLPKNRRRPRSSSDAPQDRVDATLRRDRGAHPKVVVPENVVPRSVNLVTGKEEIEVLDAGELAVERSSKRPARNRIVQSGNVTITTDARGRVSTQRRRHTKLHPYLRHGW